MMLVCGVTCGSFAIGLMLPSPGAHARAKSCSGFQCPDARRQPPRGTSYQARQPHPMNCEHGAIAATQPFSLCAYCCWRSRDCETAENRGACVRSCEATGLPNDKFPLDPTPGAAVRARSLHPRWLIRRGLSCTRPASTRRGGWGSARGRSGRCHCATMWDVGLETTGRCRCLSPGVC